jgi:hypothetical protein
MEIRIFNYREPKLLSEDTKTLVENLTSHIYADWERINSSLPRSSCESLTISVVELDGRAQLHCDKWIEEAAMHMSLYSAAQQPSGTPQVVSPDSVAGQRQILKYKSFSGDVSGVIGEALFSLILVKHFKLTDFDFAHFRADKTSGLHPDFGIYVMSDELRTELDWDGKSTIDLPVPVEVKTITTASTSIIKERLFKAIEQIKNYWRRTRRPGGTSIICVAIRNQYLCSYDVALIWGR